MNKIRNKINEFDHKKRQTHNKLLELQSKFTSFEIKYWKTQNWRIKYNILITENEIINELNHKIKPMN